MGSLWLDQSAVAPAVQLAPCRPSFRPQVSPSFMHGLTVCACSNQLHGGTAQHSTVQHNTAQHSAAQPSMGAWYLTAYIITDMSGSSQFLACTALWLPGAAAYDQLGLACCPAYLGLSGFKQLGQQQQQQQHSEAVCCTVCGGGGALEHWSFGLRHIIVA